MLHAVLFIYHSSLSLSLSLSLKQNFVKVYDAILTGDEVKVVVTRTAPAAGAVSVHWTIEGVNEHAASLGFLNTTGVLYFAEV